jgi:hypothetical protein
MSSFESRPAYSRRSIVALLSIAYFAAAQETAAAATLRTVALTGQQAPGTLSGVAYASLSTPVLNAAGRTAFAATVSGNDVDSTNNLGIWSEGSGSLALVAREGSQAPGTPNGVNFGVFVNELVLNAAGQTAFYATLTGDIVTGTDDYGVWSEGYGNLAPSRAEG